MSRLRLAALSGFSLAAALVAAAPHGLGQSAGREAWEAESKTAMSVTGNVAFTPVRIVFAHGVALSLQFVRQVPGLAWSADLSDADKTAPADLYRVVPPKDPVLLRGNQLCGMAPVTYLSVLRKPDGTVSLSVYTDKDEPTVAANKMCAGYTYVLRAPKKA